MAKIDFSRFSEWEPCQTNGKEPSLLEKCIIDLTKGYPEIEYLLRKNGVGCIPRGDIQMIVGPQKSGKTFASMIFEIALLSGNCMEFEAQQDNLTILHIDTEQHRNSVADKNRKLLSLAGYSEKQNYERLIVVSIKELSASERLNIIEEAVEKNKPDFVLIDGIRDLCEDFNDIKQSNHVINSIMRLCSQYNCAIMCVIHQNKAKGDDNPRGHLGTELMNKCSEGYYVTRSVDTPVMVSQKVCRNATISDWYFNINNDGKPEVASAPMTSKDLKTIEIRNNFKQIFADQDKLPYTQLVNEYVEITGYSKSTAKNHIKAALKDEVIVIEGKHYFYLFPPCEDETKS